MGGKIYSVKNGKVNYGSTSPKWVADLKVAKETNQLVIVAASGSSATITMHNKNSNGIWNQIVSTNGNIGRKGLGKTAEGDEKTPKGIYHFTFAFGNKSNPGSKLSYTKVDNSYYWVDDSKSVYYNRLVSTKKVKIDWTSAESIAKGGSSYNYVLAIDYNASCTPGVGSAIFMHCNPKGGTSGCIAIPESDMIKIIKNVYPGCVLIIDTTNGVKNY